MMFSICTELTHNTGYAHRPGYMISIHGLLNTVT